MPRTPSSPPGCPVPEGAGIADVLLRDGRGKVQHDFHGCSRAFPGRAADQYTNNAGQPGYDPLFPLGHGLRYADRGTLPLSEEPRHRPERCTQQSVVRPRGRHHRADPAAGRRGRRGDGRDPSCRRHRRRFAGDGGDQYHHPGRRAPVRLQGCRRGPAARRTHRSTWCAKPTATCSWSRRCGWTRCRQAARRRSASIAATAAAASCRSATRWRRCRGASRTRLGVQLRCLREAGADTGKLSVPFALRGSAGLRLSLSQVALGTAFDQRVECSLQ